MVVHIYINIKRWKHINVMAFNTILKVNDTFGHIYKSRNQKKTASTSTHFPPFASDSNK